MNDRPSRESRIELSLFGSLLILIALSIAAGRIAVVHSKEGDTAFLSANDRSRWCTVAALVEDGSYAIDRLIEIKDRSGKRRPWSTIDRVQHTGPDGKMHSYSSKPPLFSTMVAGVYWCVHLATGMTLTAQPIYVARIVLALVNLPIFFVFLWATWRSIFDSSASDFAKLVALAVACFGTALLPMVVSLNNHLPAAMATAVVLNCYLRVAGEIRWRVVASKYLMAGLAAGFTVANELPAAAMLVAWTILFYRQHVQATLLLYLPGVIVVALAFFVSNHVAHQSFRPPYMHRSDGAVLGIIEAKQASGIPSSDEVAEVLKKEMPKVAFRLPVEVLATQSPDRWLVESADKNRRWALVRSSETSANVWSLRQWDHWYDYPGSYWMTTRQGVDRGEESRLRYLFHTTIGYFGIFSLTPIWLLVPGGIYRRIQEPQGRYRQLLAIAIAAVTLICFAFYLSRPLIDRNYGGVSSSFRWMLWFTPLWIWGMTPTLSEALLKPKFKSLVLLALALSIISAATALDNPWQMPWIYRYASFLGWLDS